MSNKNNFAKLGFIYAIGQILSKAISFLLLPIYIKQLGLIGFGQLSLVDAIFNFIGSFTIIGVYSGYIRFYREYEENQKTKLKNTAFSFALIMCIINIALTLTLGKFLSNSIFNFGNSYYILILVMGRSMISQLVILLMCDYGLNYKAGINVTLNLINLLLNLAFTLLLVVFKKRGIIGIYEGYVLSNLIMLIYLVFVDHSKYKFEIDVKMLKNMLKFSGGLIPSNIASTVLTLSDRYFLRSYRTLEETGIYSLGYKFGMLIEPLFVNPFTQIFTPYKFSTFKDYDAEEKFNLMFFKYHIVGCFIMLGICIYSKPMIYFFTSHESLVAYKIVPLIAMSYFLYGSSCFYCLGIVIKNKTYFDGLIMLSAGVVNLILNFILIPKFGMYGAALSTAISYITMNLIYIKFSFNLYPIKYKQKKIVKIYLITFTLFLIYYVVSKLDIGILMEMIIGTLLLCIYIISCIFANLISADELKKYIVVIFEKNKTQ